MRDDIGLLVEMVALVLFGVVVGAVLMWAAIGGGLLGVVR